jgi:hypothetical protein
MISSIKELERAANVIRGLGQKENIIFCNKTQFEIFEDMVLRELITVFASKGEVKCVEVLGVVGYAGVRFVFFNIGDD